MLLLCIHLSPQIRKYHQVVVLMTLLAVLPILMKAPQKILMGIATMTLKQMVPPSQPLLTSLPLPTIFSISTTNPADATVSPTDVIIVSATECHK